MPMVDIWGVPTYPLILGTVVPLWPAPETYFQMPALLPDIYFGAYPNRQQRFSLRSFRRTGIYLGDLSVVDFWDIGGGNDSWGA